MSDRPCNSRSWSWSLNDGANGLHAHVVTRAYVLTAVCRRVDRRVRAEAHKATEGFRARSSHQERVVPGASNAYISGPRACDYNGAQQGRGGVVVSTLPLDPIRFGDLPIGAEQPSERVIINAVGKSRRHTAKTFPVHATCLDRVSGVRCRRQFLPWRKCSKPTSASRAHHGDFQPACITVKSTTAKIQLDAEDAFINGHIWFVNCKGHLGARRVRVP